MTKCYASKVIEIALGEVGYLEKASNNNELFTYQASLQNVTGPDSDIIIVRKP